MLYLFADHWYPFVLLFGERFAQGLQHYVAMVEVDAGGNRVSCLIIICLDLHIDDLYVL